MKTLTKVSLDEMWRTIEGHGFVRKNLEQTNPDHETIFKLYQAILEIHRNELNLEQASKGQN